MKSAHQQSQQLDTRQLILDADFEALSMSEPRMMEMRRQWTVQLSSWLGTSDDGKSSPT